MSFALKQIFHGIAHDFWMKTEFLTPAVSYSPCFDGAIFSLPELSAYAVSFFE